MSFTDVPAFDADARKKDGARPQFFMDKAQNRFRSEKEGRPCFDDVEMVRILVPGDRLTESVQRVREEHKHRWPREYEAFRANREAPLQGTPLDQLPGITAARVAELAYFHVRTIEDLAGLPDDLLKKAASMDGFGLREKAQRWLKRTEDSAGEEKLAAENRELRARMEAMEKQLADMQTVAKSLEAQVAAAGGAHVGAPPAKD